MATQNTAAGPLPFVEQLVAGLAQANVAIPVIFASATLLIQAWKAIRPGEDVDPQVLANLIEAQVRKNAEKINAEIERLREKLAQEQRS